MICCYDWLIFRVTISVSMVFINYSICYKFNITRYIKKYIEEVNNTILALVNNFNVNLLTIRI